MKNPLSPFCFESLVVFGLFNIKGPEQYSGVWVWIGFIGAIKIKGKMFYGWVPFANSVYSYLGISILGFYIGIRRTRRKE